ncbi:MAG TPA: DHH family phosphoesterase [Candidatus Dojkabacteria bacterium]|nr:DHH family phosphoesterase [Candidatus Dojkabacteria bacterium]
MKYKELLDLIKSSKRILITSHLSPDPDAIGSSLFVYNILKENFKDKEFVINIEGGAGTALMFLNNAKDISDNKLSDQCREFNPDLIIVTDVNSFSRVTKSLEELNEYLRNNKTSVAFIDHHGLDGHDNADFYLDNRAASCCEEVYKVFYEDFGLKLPEGYKECLITGILADTGNFIYPKIDYKDTFRIVLSLLKDGLVIESVVDQMSSYNKLQLNIVSELIGNIVVEKDYVYSFLSDQYIEDNVVGKMSATDFKSAKNLFVNFYLKIVDNRKFGFLVAFDPRVIDERTYNGSFRSRSDGVDTTVFTKLLGGDGHKFASGFSFEAPNLEEAIKIVKKVIEDNLEKAVEGGKAK